MKNRSVAALEKGPPPPRIPRPAANRGRPRGPRAPRATDERHVPDQPGKKFEDLLTRANDSTRAVNDAKWRTNSAVAEKIKAKIDDVIHERINEVIERGLGHREIRIYNCHLGLTELEFHAAISDDEFQAWLRDRVKPFLASVFTAHCSTYGVLASIRIEWTGQVE
jgi:hypothetical protein